jgi:hypothetical protein
MIMSFSFMLGKSGDRGGVKLFQMRPYLIFSKGRSKSLLANILTFFKVCMSGVNDVSFFELTENLDHVNHQACVMFMHFMFQI